MPIELMAEREGNLGAEASVARTIDSRNRPPHRSSRLVAIDPLLKSQTQLSNPQP